MTLPDALSSFQCKVCGAVPDSYGRRVHEKCCFEVSDNGGGEDYPELYRYDAELCAKLEADIREHHRVMTLGPWAYDTDRGRIFGPGPNQFLHKDIAEMIVGNHNQNAASIALIRNNLPAIADQIAAARRRIAELEFEVKDRGCPVHSNQLHGKEAEELRCGVEKAVEEYWANDVDRSAGRTLCRALVRLLRTTDARDSLAYIERIERTKVNP